MKRQPLTQERLIGVQFSMQKMGILAQMLLLENQQECDVDYRIPYINNFAKRIGSDCVTIMNHIKKSGRMNVVVNDDFAVDYAGELWRIVTLLAGLDVSWIKDFADNLEKEIGELQVAEGEVA